MPYVGSVSLLVGEHACGQSAAFHVERLAGSAQAFDNGAWSDAEFARDLLDLVSGVHEAEAFALPFGQLVEAVVSHARVALIPPGLNLRESGGAMQPEWRPKCLRSRQLDL